MPIEPTVISERTGDEEKIIVKINFDPDDGSAARVFEIASELIKSFEDIDRVLIGSLSSELSTFLILEDLQKSSVKIWLKNVLGNIDDAALKDLSIKKLIGSFLIKGKYAAIRWLDSEDTPDKPKRLSDLTDEVARLARESDIRHLPDYPPPNPTRLTQSLERLQGVKSRFRSNESLEITLGKDQYRVVLDNEFDASKYLDDGEEKQLSNESDLILIIKKPDFLANSRWQFKHGKSNITALIEDEDWLADFRAGKHPLKPGDALRVRMRFDYTYSSDGNLTDTKQRIVRVYSVSHQQQNGELFEP